MAEQLQLDVVTPEKAVFNEMVDTVVIPGTAGELGVLPGHLPLLTSIAMGRLSVETGGKTRSFFIEGGYAEILPDRVTVLTEMCEGVSEIDIAEARAALEQAEKDLTLLEERGRSEEIEADTRKRHTDALERARRRLVLAEESDK